MDYRETPLTLVYVVIYITFSGNLKDILVCNILNLSQVHCNSAVVVTSQDVDQFVAGGFSLADFNLGI